MAVEFGDLHVHVLPCGRKYELIEDFTSDINGELYVVEKGFVTDFASVPRVLWNIIPPSGRYTRPAVLHDWMYSSCITSRTHADRTFLDGMAALGVPWIKRWPMYLGVRLGGWVPWNRYRRRQP